MRKLIYTAALLFCFQIAFSQDKYQEEWAFGANAGITSSSVSFSPRVSQESLNQLAGGVTVRYISEKHFGLQGELNLSQRGWKEHKDSIPQHKYTQSLLYAELPVMTHLFFNLSSRMRLIFNMGPQISYLLSEKTLEESIVPDPSTPNPIQYTTKVQNKFDWGIIGGGGLEVRSGIGSFILEGRYYFGLSDIYNNKKSDYYAASSNQVLQVKLTYFYRY